MAKTTSWGYTDGTPKNLPIADIDWAGNFGAVDLTARQTVVTNVTSPVDQPEKVTFSTRPVKDIYASSNINPAFRDVRSDGLSAVTILEEVLSVTDSANPLYRVDFPVKVTLTLTAPVSGSMTEANLLHAVTRAVGCMFDKSSVTGARVAELYRGVTNPLV